MESVLEILFLSLILGGIGTSIATLFINMFIMPFRKKIDIEKAIENGHVVTAHMIRFVTPKGEARFRENYISGYYKYEVKGKTYKKKFFFCTIPPETVELYYKSNPAKAMPELKFGKMESGKLYIYIITTALVFLWMLFFSKCVE